MALAQQTALATTVAILAVVNLLNNRRAVRAYVATSLVSAALLLALGRLAGLSWGEIGLGRDALAPGVRWGLLLAVIVAACYLVGAALPTTRSVFVDRRVEGVGPGVVGYQALVRIPLGTVLLEEVAFRGVLYGLGWHLYGPVAATVVSCALFGLWHVLPALDVVKLNRVAGQMFRAYPPLFVLAAVLATALAGVILCELRRRTGSLLPAVTVHWATNALGYLTAFLVAPRR
jgi:membrane protease YdiL (CAAX protease family)